MGLYSAALCLAGLFALTSCLRQPSGASQVSENAEEQSTLPEDMVIAKRQWVYVPAYARVNSSDAKHSFALAVTVTVRNTDLENPIFVRTVRYYSESGILMKELVSTPLRVAPMAMVAFPMEQFDRSDGIGANFLVEWVAETVVNEPIIEALMVSQAGEKGFSFATSGRVLKQVQ